MSTRADTVLEGSQVGYWLFLLAATHALPLDDFAPHAAILKGFTSGYSDEQASELRLECVSLLAHTERENIVKGIQLGFTFIGWACFSAEVSPLAPVETDLAQMRRKGLVP
jgi:hypothetical protein